MLRGMHNEHGSYVKKVKRDPRREVDLHARGKKTGEVNTGAFYSSYYRYARCLDTKSEADHGYRVRLCRPVASKGLILMTRTDRPDSRIFCGDQRKQGYTKRLYPRHDDPHCCHRLYDRRHIRILWFQACLNDNTTTLVSCFRPVREIGLTHDCTVRLPLLGPSKQRVRPF